MNKSIEEKRDLLALKYVKHCQDNQHAVYGIAEAYCKADFKAGFDAGYAIGLEQAKVLVEALQKYANGTALRVKPEKTHLYVEDIYNGNPLWHQRSMSDYDDKILAKEALKLFKEGVEHE